jgi:L-fuconolactonase
MPSHWRGNGIFGERKSRAPRTDADRLSDGERAMLMGGACAKAYGWSPKKG